MGTMKWGNNMFNDNQLQLFNDLVNEGKLNELPKRVLFMKAWDDIRAYFKPDEVDRLNEFDEIMEMMWSEDRFS
jgi:hypothetical protein